MKNDYYVYLHKTLNGKVFYVGKGRENRAWKKSRRSKAWNECAANGFSVEIYRNNLSEANALEIENTLIKTLEGLVNSRILSPVRFDDYADYFEYDPSSPSCLTRTKVISIGNKIYSHAGHCGCKLKRACGNHNWVVSFRERTVQVHRIIWQLFNGTIPDGFIIDHIDGNPLNNLITNLRLITKTENNRNTGKAKNNTSGVVGVSLGTNNGVKGAVWTASYYNPQGKRVAKKFSVKKHGNEEAFRLACEYRAQKIRELNEQGAGYTERHGK